MKRGGSCLLLALSLAGSMMVQTANADLQSQDADDVGFRLDVRGTSSLSFGHTLGLAVEFYGTIARRQQPRVRVLYDAFGGSRPDFVLRFHYYRISGNSFGLACDFVRLSDRAHLSVSPADDQPDYVYCEFPRPWRMEAGSGIRWRVVAVMPGAGRDLAPDAGWYPHA